MQVYHQKEKFLKVIEVAQQLMTAEHPNVEEAEIGFAFAVIQNGEILLSLSAGVKTQENKQNTDVIWQENNLAAIYSSGKAVLSVLLAKAISEGKIDISLPVKQYWPEFAKESINKANTNKASITVQDVLLHKSGFMGLAQSFEPSIWLDWQKICKQIEIQDPPVAKHEICAYSPQLFGIIIARVLENIYNCAFKEILHNYTCLWDMDVFCGLNDLQLQRTVKMKKPTSSPDLGKINKYKEIAFILPHASPAKVSWKEWAKSCLPASNMHASALGLAKALHVFACDGKLKDHQIIDKKILDDYLQPQAVIDNQVLPFDLSFAGGLMVNNHGAFGLNPLILGHSGFGGSAVMIDRGNNISMAYVMNRMSAILLGDPRPKNLMMAAYEDLAL